MRAKVLAARHKKSVEPLLPVPPPEALALPIVVRTDNARAHADMNTDHPTPYKGIGDAYKHIP